MSHPYMGRMTLGTRLFTVTTQDSPEGHALLTAHRTALAAEMAKG